MKQFLKLFFAGLILAIVSLTYIEAKNLEKANQEKSTASCECQKEQTVFRSGTQMSFKGPEKYFTGDVQVEMLFPSNDTAHYSGAFVTFQPGARTAWHYHPAGQHMIVTSGVALTGTRDKKIIRFSAGETVWCPPDIDHWHGATPDAPMTHLVITGSLDGKNVIWKEKVTDEQYSGKKEQ